MLTPEEKISMTLDEIIKVENIKPAISHNLNNRRRYKGNFRRPPLRRRLRSQQWRLGRNGPHPPRWRNPSWGSAKHYYQYQKNIETFLARKQSDAPPGSVFHRLGWNPTRYAAQRFLQRAKFYQKPRGRLFYRPPRYQHTHDPFRFQKILAAQKVYESRNGLRTSNSQAKTLNEYNLSQLSAALGGTITSVTENVSPEGSVVTVIKRNPGNQDITLDPHFQREIAILQKKPMEYVRTVGNAVRSASFLPRVRKDIFFVDSGPPIYIEVKSTFKTMYDRIKSYNMIPDSNDPPSLTLVNTSPMPGLSSGAFNPGVFSGASNPGLSSGASRPSLFSGASRPGLFSGASDPGQFSGTPRRGLFSAHPPLCSESMETE